jgi:hypothetical protein
MVHFQTKAPNLDKFGRALCRMENVAIFYGRLVFWYMFPHSGILCREKSGNPCVSRDSKKISKLLFGEKEEKRARVKSWK